LANYHLTAVLSDSGTLLLASDQKSPLRQIFTGRFLLPAC